MHFDCFKYFYEVANTKSISKVAHSCHISQSALSQQLKNLEESLGEQLLTRSNKGVTLTKQGKVVKKHVENMIKTYNKMIQELENLDKYNKTIEINSCWTLSTYALPCTLYKMKKIFPNHNYKLTSDFSDDIEQNILNDIYDLGFVYGQPIDESLKYFKTATDDLVLVSSSNFNIPDEIELKDLLNYPLIMLNDRLNIEKSLNNHLKVIGHSCGNLNILFNLDSTESVKSSLFQGHGIAFLPYLSLKSELYTKQLKRINVVNFSIHYDIYLIYKKSSRESTPIREFLEYFTTVGKKSFC